MPSVPRSGRVRHTMREARSRPGKRSEDHVFLQQRTARAGDGREMDDPSIAGLRLYRQMTFRSSDDAPPTPAKAIEPVPAPPSHTQVLHTHALIICPRTPMYTQARAFQASQVMSNSQRGPPAAPSLQTLSELTNQTQLIGRTAASRTPPSWAPFQGNPAAHDH